MEIKANTAGESSGLMKFAMVILAIAVAWRYAPIQPAYIALAAVVVLFLLARKRPVWALAAFLVAQLSISSVMIPLPVVSAISLRLLLLALTVVIMWRELALRKLGLTPWTKAVLIPTILLAVWSLIANLTYSGFDFGFKDLRNMIVAMLIIVLIPAATKDVKDLKILATVALVTLSASATIGIAQYFGFLGMDQQTVIPGFLERLKDSPRVPGMSESFLNLSYVLSVGILVIIGLYMAKGVKSGSRPILIASIVMMAVALYFTFTRSNYLALVMGFGVLGLILVLKTKLNAAVIVTIVLAGVSVFEFSGIMDNQFLGGRSAESQDTSTLSRKVLWQAGAAIAMDNPILGIGGDRFKTVSPEYASRVDPALMARQAEYWSYRDLGSQQPHNDFLFMAVSYGVPALVAYTWVLIVTLRNFLTAYRSSTGRFVRGLSLGMAAGTVVYTANAFYHNMMITFPLFWILAGLSVAAANLALQKKARATATVA